MSDKGGLREQVQAIRQRSVQAIGAGLSRRNWHATETAYNELRDKLDELLRQAATPVLSSEDRRDGGEGWQPISSAPKDGTLIFVARDMGKPWGWVRGVSRWDGAHGIYGWISRGLYDPPGELGLGQPDVWLPIPKPPAAPSPEQEGE